MVGIIINDMSKTFKGTQEVFKEFYFIFPGQKYKNKTSLRGFFKTLSAVVTLKTSSILYLYARSVSKSEAK